MITLGLTGSIGMGKSTTAAMFADGGLPGLRRRRRGAQLYATGGAAVAPVEAAFPGVDEGRRGRPRGSQRAGGRRPRRRSTG